MSKIPKKYLNFIFISVLLLTLFYTFSFFLVKGGGLSGFDFDTTVRIQDNIPKKYDYFLSLFSLVGSFEVTFLMLVTLVIIRRKILSFLSIAMFGVMHVVEIVGKAFLDHPPTPFRFHRYNIDFSFPTSYVQPGGSYPSGHSMRTVFLAIIIVYLIFLARKKIPPKISAFLFLILLTFVSIMLVSRVSLGEHWISDVLGGSVLGAAFAFLTLIFI